MSPPATPPPTAPPTPPAPAAPAARPTGPLSGPAGQAILARYPEGHRRSAVMPLLRLAQERDGHVTQEAMHEVASILGLSPAEVLSVCSFYSMFHQKPKGRHVISVCHNLSCTLMGAEEILDFLEETLGVSREGETTPDGAFTLEHAECLAACDIAPCVQIDYDRMVGPVTLDDVEALLTTLRAGGAA